MAQPCYQSLGICAARFTRLNADGTLAAGPSNAYVIEKVMSLGVEPIVTAGDQKELVSGCDDLIATYNGVDKPRGFNLTLAVGELSPPMIEMLTGAPAITDPNTPANVIGWHHPVSATPHAAVAVEAWSKAWDGDGQAVAPYAWYHWIFTYVNFRFDTATLGNDFFQPQLVGRARANASWGMGPYGSQPQPVTGYGAAWLTDQRPTGFCGYLTASSVPE